MKDYASMCILYFNDEIIYRIINNMKKSCKNTKEIEIMLNNTCYSPSDILRFLFTWTESNEGITYWQELHYKTFMEENQNV